MCLQCVIPHLHVAEYSESKNLFKLDSGDLSTDLVNSGKESDVFFKNVCLPRGCLRLPNPTIMTTTQVAAQVTNWVSTHVTTQVAALVTTRVAALVTTQVAALVTTQVAMEGLLILFLATRSQHVPT